MSASAYRPVEQSPECKQAERDRYEFVMRMIIIHDIWYLQGKTADKSPPPQALPARAAKLLGKVIRFYAAHYPPKSQGEKSYTDPRTGGPTCKMNEIIYDTIYASLPDDCKLTFAQMFCNFVISVHSRHHCMLMAKKMTSKSTSSIFSPTRNVLNGGASLLTI